MGIFEEKVHKDSASVINDLAGKVLGKEGLGFTLPHQPTDKLKAMLNAGLLKNDPEAAQRGLEQLERVASGKQTYNRDNFSLVPREMAALLKIAGFSGSLDSAVCAIKTSGDGLNCGNSDLIDKRFAEQVLNLLRDNGLSRQVVIRR